MMFIKYKNAQYGINKKIKVGDVPVMNYNWNDLYSGTLIPSLYNGDNMKSLITESNDKYYGVSNINFNINGKVHTIQFATYNANGARCDDIKTTITNINNNVYKPIELTKHKSLEDKEIYAFDAYNSILWFFLFLFHFFGKIGVFDSDETIVSLVNDATETAYYNGHYFVFGNGCLYCRSKPLTSLEIVGHECAHAIFDSLGGLSNKGESGAISEAISDIFGIGFKFFYQLTNLDVTEISWEIGKECKPVPMRSLKSPRRFFHPKYYKGAYWICPDCEADNGGVHYNAGVINYLFYVLIKGGTQSNDNQTHYINKMDIFDLLRYIYNVFKINNGTYIPNMKVFKNLLIVNCTNPYVLASIYKSMDIVGL